VARRRPFLFVRLRVVRYFAGSVSGTVVKRRAPELRKRRPVGLGWIRG
jgi:hypothetical protein